MARQKNKQPLATVFIPTYNGEEYLQQLLKAVISQKTDFEYEVLVIDSGSKDSTIEIVNKFPIVKLHKIPNKEFGHGKTRNLAASMAKGEFIVYLSQDAVPAHKKWLSGMIEPFYLNDGVYCVFGKQTPRPKCDITTKREVKSVFKSLGPDHSLMVHRSKMLNENHDVSPALTFFSDVNSAVRRESLLNDISYRDVRYAEDQLLGYDVLEAGYMKVYTPTGEVLHSNEYSLRDSFYRKFDEYLAMYEVMGHKPPGHIRSYIKPTIKNSIKDMIFTLRDKEYSPKRKVFNLLESPFRNIQHARASYHVGNDRLRIKGLKTNSLEHRKKSRSK